MTKSKSASITPEELRQVRMHIASLYFSAPFLPEEKKKAMTEMENYIINGYKQKVA